MIKRTKKIKSLNIEKENITARKRVGNGGLRFSKSFNDKSAGKETSHYLTTIPISTNDHISEELAIPKEFESK